jgi:hypothetical protein
MRPPTRGSARGSVPGPASRSRPASVRRVRGASVNGPRKSLPPQPLPSLPPRQLLRRALDEIDKLGTRPRSGEGRWRWDEERRGAADRLADLAGRDRRMLRRAALHDPRNRRHRKAAELLRDAETFGWNG